MTRLYQAIFQGLNTISISIQMNRNFVTMALITIVMAILIVQILIVRPIPALIMVLTETDVKPILAVIIAEKIKHVLNLWSPMLNYNVMQMAAVGTKRKKPVRSGRKILRKNSSTDLHFFLKVNNQAGPAMARPDYFHVPQTIMKHK